MAAGKIVLVTGATGKQGSATLRNVAKRGGFKLRAATRKPERVGYSADWPDDRGFAKLGKPPDLAAKTAGSSFRARAECRGTCPGRSPGRSPVARAAPER